MKTNSNNIIKVALMFAAFVFMTACSVEEANQSVRPLSEQLDITETLQFTAKETSNTFEVTSDVGWEVSIDQTADPDGNPIDWKRLQVSPMSGTGSAQVTIQTDENTTRQGRQAIIIVKTKGGISQKLLVNQAASGVILDISGGDNQSFAFEASPTDSMKFSFTCNSTWEISTNQSWIKCDKTEGGESITTTQAYTISVIAEEIQTDKARTDGLITIKAENGAETRQIKVTQEGKKIELSVSPGNFEFDAAAEQNTIQIKCNADWTLDCKDGFVLCDVTSGTGNRDVVVTCQANTKESQRSTTITVQSGIDNIQTKTINVTQVGKQFELSVSPTNIDISSDGEQKTIQINCNADWSLDFKDDFIQCDAVSGTGSRDVILTCLPNERESQRTSTISVKTGVNNIITETINISQAGKVYELSASPSVLEVSATGETKTIQIKCNADWTLNCKDEYIQCDVTRGTGTGNVVVTCLANHKESQRTSTITIKTGLENILSETVNITQAAATRPVINSFKVVEGSVTKSQASFTIDIETMYPISEYGIYYWVDGYSSKKEKLSFSNSDSSAKTFNVALSGLKSMTNYRVYAYVKNDVAEVSTSSNALSFTTAGVKPGDDDNPTPNLSRKK
jgi:hypothetical protein